MGAFWEDLVKDIRSENLAEVRKVLAWLQRQMPGAFTLPPVLNFIPDANCILKELDYLCRRQQKSGGKTALQEVVDAGSARLFATADLEQEILENIPVIAGQTNFPPERYIEAWRGYKNRIHFFRRTVRGSVSLSDPDDVYLFDAQSIIGADGIISDDSVVLATGRALKPTRIHRSLRQFTRAEAVRRTLAIQGMLFLLLAGKGLQELIKLCIRRPNVGIPAVLGVAGTLFLVDRWRAGKTGRSFIKEIWGGVRGEGVALLDALGDMTKSSEANLAEVERELAGRPVRTLKQYINTTLIYSAKPISESTLIDAIHLDGYDAWASDRSDDETFDARRIRLWARFEQDVRQRLQGGEDFLRQPDGWTTKLLPHVGAIEVVSPMGSSSVVEPLDAHVPTMPAVTVATRRARRSRHLEARSPKGSMNKKRSRAPKAGKPRSKR
jgi:hypothetical protein